MLGFLLLVLVSGAFPACGRLDDTCLTDDSCPSLLAEESALISSLELLQVGMSVKAIASDKGQGSSALTGAGHHRPQAVLPQEFALGTSEEDITNLRRAQDQTTRTIATVDHTARFPVPNKAEHNSKAGSVTSYSVRMGGIEDPAHALIVKSIGPFVFREDHGTALGDVVKAANEPVEDKMEKPLAVFLMMPLALTFVLAWKSWPASGLPPFVISFKTALPLSYLCVSSGAVLSMRQTKGSAATTTIEAALVMYVLKAAVSLVLLLYKQSMSIGDISRALGHKEDDAYFPTWCHIALIGGLYAAYDALHFLAAQFMPPVTFQLLLNSRVLLIAPLQWAILGKRIARLQVVALLLICVAACALSLGDISEAAADEEAKSSQHDLYVGIALIGGKVVLSAVALVVNEKLLKSLPLTVDAQNLCMYIFGMGFLGIAMVVEYLASGQTNIVWVLGDLFGCPWMLTAIAMMTTLGILCSYLLKTYSAMDKEVLGAGTVGLLAVGQYLSPDDASFKPHSIQCALMIIASSFTFRLNEPEPAGEPKIPEPAGKA
jgi:drug/metabolite transporter (DMT)-like permease